MKLFNKKGAMLVAALAVAAVSCSDDDDVTGNVVTTDFTGTFVQQDQMGRPGINTVFPTTDAEENAFNTTLPADGIARWQPTFQSKVEALYTAYSNTAGTTLTYENNILGLDLPTLTTALALDVLQVAPNATTNYFNPTTGLPLTGRALSDDVIDVSLILLFGGNTGARFDGNNGTPNLVSDNVGLEPGVIQSAFPYLTAPRF